MNEKNEMKVFDYNEHQVRTVEQNGEPWFVLKDVCDVLGLNNPTVVAERLDDDERAKSDLGRQGAGWIISESGLYNVILRSDKPEAKPFRRWVTSEVLPSIRRTGGYIKDQDTLSAEELIAKAVIVAQKTLAEREARLAALTVENQIMAPKAEYFDELCYRGTLTNFRETAKELGVSPKKFVNDLVEGKYIYRDKRGKLLPYEGANDGYFEVKETYNEKTKWSGTQTLVTPKGREAFRLLSIGK